MTSSFLGSEFIGRVEVTRALEDIAAVKSP
jgi:hypothetical protein